MDAEEIVRGLAAKDPPIDSEFGYCHLCDFVEPTPPSVWRVTPSSPKAHKPDCPWRLAREWVAKNPV
jgi:hypothetical protein